MKNRKKNPPSSNAISFTLNNFGVHLSLQSWWWCLICCSVVVSSKGTHKVEQNYTKSPTKCLKFKCNTVSVSFSAYRCSSVVFTSKVGREKTRSLKTGLWMAICSCGLPAHCCQSAFAGDVIYADLWGELNIPLALQALFTQSFLVYEPLLQAFPFPSILEEVTLHPLSLACMFVYSSHEKWVFPPLLWSFPPSATLTSIPAPGCWACAPAPARASPARPGLFIYVLGRIFLPHSSELKATHPLCNVSLLFLLLITQFLFFPWVEVCLSRDYTLLAQGCL
jgi:hypothetical protein